ncbi:MAG: presenilin family intramembrane aspartyl protease [Candidatus Parvarchaeota archaeon]|nr:presenilin family intramembrane aspartyl protease [Candidatus Parvarchaeota archaeon]MCW1295627.1 presenilin family intramembrane aspartyl protease [Candidatus Parvarchaeum tengchongense]MCW1299294.1 presenilin family intramembrane aspartyl protease [Candidatus Parvarchaeum tengchongense]MCW1312133.1 presenilin family intramembrane aspartyl protease [Candidatus Parvarchaeum tengchongense]
MKTNIKIALLLLTIFTTVLIASSFFAGVNLKLFSVISLQTGINYNVTSPFYYLLYIIIAGLLVPTAIILLLVKYRKLKIINIVLILLFLFVMYAFSDMLLLDIFVFPLHGNLNSNSSLLAIFSLLVYILPVIFTVYYFKYAGKYAKDFLNVILFVSISAVISLYLNIITALILIAIISVYDYISVFITKHMLTLAKAFSDNSFGGISLMAKKAKRQEIFLGGGDMAFPAILANEFFLHYNLLSGIFAIIGAVIGLSIILFLGKKGKAYPAMAAIGPMQFAFLGLYFLIRFI